MARQPFSHQMDTYPLTRVITHHDTTKSLYIRLPFAVAPGQFVMLWLPGHGEKPFSVSDVDDGFMEITVCAVGDFTRRIMACEEGDYLGIRGPFGNGFSANPRGLLVGGGMGIAPLRHLAREMARLNMEHTVVLGARSRNEIIFANKFATSLCHFVTEDGSLGVKGLVTEPVRSILAEGTVDCVYACGPEAMLVALRDLAEEHDVDYQFALERYMKCGIGLCGSCCLDGPGFRVCVEGPVFNRQQIAQITEFGQPHRGPTGARG